MKKNRLFLLIMISSLISCNNQNNASTNNISNSQSSYVIEEVSSSTSIVEEIIFNKDYIINYLNNASKSSYQVNYLNNGVEQYDIYTNKYLYVSTTSRGYIELDSFDSKYGNNIVYNYYLDEDNVNLGACLTTTNSIGKVVPVKTIQSLNYFSLWNSSKFTTDKLINAGELGIFTEDQEMIAILGGVLGYYSSSSQGAFTKVFFNQKDNGLEISLEIAKDYVSSNNIDKITATLNNVGSASVKTIDNYLSSFTMSNEKLNNENNKRIIGKNIHLKAKFIYIENNEEVGLPMELEVKMDNSHIYTSISENGKTTSNMIQKAKENDVNGQYLEGDSISSYIDGTNSIVAYSNGVKFVDYEFPYSYKDDVLNSFVKTSNNKYHYYGLNGNDYITSLLRCIPGSGSETVSSIDLELKDDKVSKMFIKYDRNGRYAEDGVTPIFSYYQCEVEFFDLEGIEDITPYESIDNQTNIIKNAFDVLTSGSTYYHAEGYDIEDKKAFPVDYDINEIYVTEDTILINERKLGVLNNIKGWHKKDNKIIPFVIHKDKNNNYDIVATKPSEENELSSYIPWSVSENVFELNDNNEIIVRNNVINIHKYIYTGPYAPSMVMSTFKMSLDSQNRINKITYNCDTVTANSVEQVDIDYDNYSLPNEFQTLIDNLEEFKTPTSWQEESSIIYDRIKYFLGEGNEDKLPYLYDEKNFGIRTASVIDDVNTNLPKYLHIYTNLLSIPNDYNFYNATFVDNYKLLLEELGYVKQININAPHNGTMYLLNDMLIEVCNKDVDGIYVSKV